MHPAPAVALAIPFFVPDRRRSAGMPIATPSTTSGALALWRVPFATVITDEASEKRPLTLRKHATSYQTEPLSARAILLAASTVVTGPRCITPPGTGTPRTTPWVLSLISRKIGGAVQSEAADRVYE